MCVQQRSCQRWYWLLRNIGGWRIRQPCQPSLLLRQQHLVHHHRGYCRYADPGHHPRRVLLLQKTTKCCIQARKLWLQAVNPPSNHHISLTTTMATKTIDFSPILSHLSPHNGNSDCRITFEVLWRHHAPFSRTFRPHGDPNVSVFWQKSSRLAAGSQWPPQIRNSLFFIFFNNSFFNSCIFYKGNASDSVKVPTFFSLNLFKLLSFFFLSFFAIFTLIFTTYTFCIFCTWSLCAISIHCYVIVQ